MTRGVKFAEHSDRLGRTFGQASCKSSLGRTLYEGSVIFFLCSVAALSARGTRGRVVRRLAEGSYKSRVGRWFGQVSTDYVRRLEQASAIAIGRLGFRRPRSQGFAPEPFGLGLRFRSHDARCLRSSSLRSTAFGLACARHAGQEALAARRPVRNWRLFVTVRRPRPTPIPSGIVSPNASGKRLLALPVQGGVHKNASRFYKPSSLALAKRRRGEASGVWVWVCVRCENNHAGHCSNGTSFQGAQARAKPRCI